MLSRPVLKASFKWSDHSLSTWLVFCVKLIYTHNCIYKVHTAGAVQLGQNNKHLFSNILINIFCCTVMSTEHRFHIFANFRTLFGRKIENIKKKGEKIRTKLNKLSWSFASSWTPLVLNPEYLLWGSALRNNFTFSCATDLNQSNLRHLCVEVFLIASLSFPDDV